MTAQIADVISIDGAEAMLFSEPLSAWFAFAPRPDFIWESTASWRGYTARWEIRQGKLFLTGLNARVCTVKNAPNDCRDHARQVGVSDLFSGQGEVFANWFSGVLRVPLGAQIEYRHMGYDSIYEFDLLLEVANGVVIGTRTVDNRLPKSGRSR